MSFARPSAVTRMFSGLMSWWITPRAWAYSRTERTWSRIGRTSSGGSLPRSSSSFRRLFPSTSSTMAITYGGGNMGNHCWWFTVAPTTVPRPLTSATDKLLERQ